MTIIEWSAGTAEAPAAGTQPALGVGPTTGAARRMGATPATVSGPVVLGVLVLLAVQLAGAVAALRAVTDAPLVAVAPLVMAAVAVARLRVPSSGPAIHDRQLDLIISVGAGLTTCVLVVDQMIGGGHELGLLALTPTAVAVLAALTGTRMLWHLRVVPALLALAWPAPWTALLSHLGPASPLRLAVVLGVAGMATAAALAGVLPSVVLRPTRRPGSPLAAQP